MSRNDAATELQSLIEQINGMAVRAERLAKASGGLVDYRWFRGVQASMSMAIGDLDQKGFYLKPMDVPQPKVEVEG